MAPDNPFQLFSPIHLAFLHRQHEKGLQVVSADLDSIEATCPDAASDPLFVYYRALAAAGRLNRRPGRKPISWGMKARLWFAKQEIDDEVKAIRARRRAGEEIRPYNGIPPRVQAADFVAHNFYFFCTGRSLLNRISRERFR